MHEQGVNIGRGVFESAVGTGKSLVLMRLLLHFGVRSLIVVPSKPLLKQLKNDLIKHFGRRNVAVVGASKLSASKMRKLKILGILTLFLLTKFITLGVKVTLTYYQPWNTFITDLVSREPS
jgi:superfamily II DNA or RNA helicase